MKDNRLHPELVGEGAEPLPQNPSQEKRCTQEIRKRWPLQITEQIVPAIHAALAAQNLDADLSQEGECLYIRYPALTAGTFWEKELGEAVARHKAVFFLEDEADTFCRLLERCQEVQGKANRSG